MYIIVPTIELLLYCIYYIVIRQNLTLHYTNVNVITEGQRVEYTTYDVGTLFILYKNINNERLYHVTL